MRPVTPASESVSIESLDQEQACTIHTRTTKSHGLGGVHIQRDEYGSGACIDILIAWSLSSCTLQALREDYVNGKQDPPAQWQRGHSS